MTSARPHLEDILSAKLERLIDLPDERAAVELDLRIRAFGRVDELHERSFAERGLIARQFELRSLWRYTRPPFASLNAWMSSGAIGGRRVNYESKAAIVELEQDVSPSVLAQVPKSNIKMMVQVSTSVRRDAELQRAACVLPPDQFAEYVERNHADQHIERSQSLHFMLPRSAAQAVEQVIEKAIERGTANRGEWLQDAAANYELSRLTEGE